MGRNSVFVLCLSISILFSSFASASWNDLYDGKSDVLFSDLQFGVLNRPTLPFEKWVRGYSQCRSEVDEMVSILKRYDQSYRFGKQKQSDAIYAEIKSILDSTTSCHDALWAAYFVKSYMLGPHPHIPMKYDNEYFKPEAAFLITLLSNEGKISPLTEEKRIELAGGNKDSLWLERNENKQFKITAFYDCAESQIYIGSDLKPFNAGASLIHEVEHLYRDKLAEQFGPIPDTHEKLKEFLVADELMATIHGGYHQVHTLKADQISGKIPWNEDYGHYGGEFNFYAVAGPLYKTIDYLPVFITPVSFKSFQASVSAYVHNQKDKTLRGYICEMGIAITEGYFGPSSDHCDVESFFPKRTFLSESYFQRLRGLRQMRNEPAFVSEMAKWQTRVLSPSPTCKKLIQFQEQGHFKEYIGTSLKKGGHGGNEGVRPCLRVHF